MKDMCILIVGDADNPFVVNEVPYLAKSFKHTLIFAMNMGGNSNCQMDFPPSVEICPVGVTKGWSRIFKYALRGMWCCDRDLRITSLDPKRILACLYARGRSNFVFRSVMNVLGEKNVGCAEGVVYSYWFADQAIAAWRIAKELNRRGGRFKSFSRAHGYDLYWERNGAGFLPYQDVSLVRLDGTFPCSDFGVRYLQKKYPTLAHRVRVARLGTVDHGIGRSPENMEIFVTCCWMVPLKRMTLFAHAFCKFLLRHEKAHWYCIGAGEEFSAVKKIVTSFGAGDDVTFMGQLDNNKIMEFYKRTPVSYFVNVSTTEGVPVAIMEAMSFGVPVIATDVGGTGELVSDECGRLIDADVSADNLVEILGKETAICTGAYQKKRKIARKVWETKASAEHNYSKWCDLLTAE